MATHVSCLSLPVDFELFESRNLLIHTQIDASEIFVELNKSQPAFI